MKKVLPILLMFLSPNVQAADGSFYFCVQKGSYPLDDIYVFRISNWDIWTKNYGDQYYVWDMNGSEVDQGAYMSSLTSNFFSNEFPFNFKIRHIPGEHNYKCRQLIEPPIKIKRLADAIMPRE